mgnify:CR=1 FL=1
MEQDTQSSVRRRIQHLQVIMAIGLLFGVMAAAPFLMYEGVSYLRQPDAPAYAPDPEVRRSVG